MFTSLYKANSEISESVEVAERLREFNLKAKTQELSPFKASDALNLCGAFIESFESLKECYSKNEATLRQKHDLDTFLELGLQRFFATSVSVVVIGVENAGKSKNPSHDCYSRLIKLMLILTTFNTGTLLERIFLPFFPKANVCATTMPNEVTLQYNPAPDFSGLLSCIVTGPGGFCSNLAPGNTSGTERNPAMRRLGVSLASRKIYEHVTCLGNGIQPDMKIEINLSLPNVTPIKIVDLMGFRSDTECDMLKQYANENSTIILAIMKAKDETEEVLNSLKLLKGERIIRDSILVFYLSNTSSNGRLNYIYVFILDSFLH